MNDDNLVESFHLRMRQIHEEAADIGYNASRFIQMVESEGGLLTAKRLLAARGYSEGLTRLWEENRLDISLEATVLQDPWKRLFTYEELEIARQKLTKLGFEPSN
jgi:hypothetical protein